MPFIPISTPLSTVLAYLQRNTVAAAWRETKRVLGVTDRRRKDDKRLLLCTRRDSNPQYDVRSVAWYPFHYECIVCINTNYHTLKPDKKKEPRERLFLVGRCVYFFAAPPIMRNIFVPHVLHGPCVAWRPVFIVITSSLFISLFALHFTQYASVAIY